MIIEATKQFVDYLLVTSSLICIIAIFIVIISLAKLINYFEKITEPFDSPLILFSKKPRH